MDQEEYEMAVMNQVEDTYYDHGNEQGKREHVPPMVDPARPPQRNDANATGSCAYPCAGSGAADGAHDGLVQAVRTGVGPTDFSSKTNSEAGDEVDGDEGVGDHFIEVGDFGYISLSLIYRTLAKHARCTCQESNISPFGNSPVVSGMASPGGSMVVGVGGADSMESSGTFSLRSRGSMFADTSSGFEIGELMQALPLLSNPLQLTADYPMELSISSISATSERDYDIPAEDFLEYDMW